VISRAVRPSPRYLAVKMAPLSVKTPGRCAPPGKGRQEGVEDVGAGHGGSGDAGHGQAGVVVDDVEDVDLGVIG
jgi:hypothetical protein